LPGLVLWVWASSWAVEQLKTLDRGLLVVGAAFVVCAVVLVRFVSWRRTVARRAAIAGDGKPS
jgi:hypothetical protein